MERVLSMVRAELYHMVNGEKVIGPHDGLSGNVDEANITDAERETGVNIEDIVKGDK